MRAFTKSVVSYTWSSSLFGLQELARFLIPQGWLQTDQAATSFEKITKATTEEMADITSRTFKLGDGLQRGSVDVMFNVLTLGILNGGKEGSSQSTGAGAPGSSSNLGGQAVSFLCQGLEALGQTAGIVGQAVGGIVPGQSCGGCSSAQTGWGPVQPPPGGGK
jgi:hypothetical protein